MCGIVGYIGEKQAAPIILDGLSKLEYRGYDSAGIAVRDGSSETEVVKAKGCINNDRCVSGELGLDCILPNGTNVIFK